MDGITVYPGAKDEERQTALHIAASQGHLAIVELLLANVDAKSKIDEVDIDGSTALHCAISHGHYRIVERLLSANANVGIRNRWGQTPLHLAVRQANDNMVNLLLRGDSRTTTDDEGNTAIHVAVIGGKMEIVKSLLAAKLDVGVRNNKGETALHQAASLGFESLVKLLLTVPQDIEEVDKNERSALHLAVAGGFANTVDLLLLNNADSMKRDYDGNTALHLATMRKLEPLHRGNREGSKQSKEILDAGGNAESKDKGGQKAIHLAALHGHGLVVKLLFETVHAQSRHDRRTKVDS